MSATKKKIAVQNTIKMDLNFKPKSPIIRQRNGARASHGLCDSIDEIQRISNKKEQVFERHKRN